MKRWKMSRATSTLLTVLAVMVLATGVAGCAAAGERETGLRNRLTLNKGARIMYEKLTPNMMVEDLNRTLDFYCNVLGFEFAMGVPENSQEIVTARQENQPLGFAVIKAGSVEMMFQAKKSLIEEIPEFSGIDIGGSLTFYIEVENVEELHARLKDKVEIIRDMQMTFYGKQEFYIRDCNGYILAFAGGIQKSS